MLSEGEDTTLSPTQKLKQLNIKKKLWQQKTHLEIGDGSGDPNRAKHQRKIGFSLCFRDAAYFRDLSQS